MSAQKTGGFHYGYLIVLSLCMILIAPVALSFSCAGIFYVPVSTDLHVSVPTFGIYMTVLMLCLTVAMPFAGRILSKSNVRVVLSACVIVDATVFAAMSTFNSVFSFYVAGAFMGIANAFLFYLATPILINNWFKTKVGSFIGLCMAFTGVGGVIFNPIGGYIISNYGWRMTYLAFAVLSLIALPFTAFVIRKQPSDKGLSKYGDTGETGSAISQELTGVTSAVAMKSSAFYTVVFFACIASLLCGINLYLPAYAKTLGMSATLGATVVSAVMLGQLLGKVLLGIINDKSGPRAGITLGLGSGFVGLSALALFAKMGVTVVMVAAFFYGICYATVAVQNPMLTRTVFGTKEYGQIYGNVATISALAGALGATLWGYIVQGTGSYTTTILIGVGLTVVAFLCGMISLSLGKKLSKV